MVWPEQTQAEKEKLCDEVLARLREEWEAASKVRLVLVQVSKRRYQVVRITNTEPMCGVMAFRGTVAYGPFPREMCEGYIRLKSMEGPNAVPDV